MDLEESWTVCESIATTFDWALLAFRFDLLIDFRFDSAAAFFDTYIFWRFDDPLLDYSESFGVHELSLSLWAFGSDSSDSGIISGSIDFILVGY